MTTNDDKSYRSFLNKLAFEYNNTYHHSINKNPINVVYSSLPEKKTNLATPKFKRNDRVRIIKRKLTTENFEARSKQAD